MSLLTEPTKESKLGEVESLSISIADVIDQASYEFLELTVRLSNVLPPSVLDSATPAKDTVEQVNKTKLGAQFNSSLKKATDLVSAIREVRESLEN